MVKKYRISYITEGSEAPPKTGHIDSFFLQFRIKDLADTVFVGWAVEELSDITDNVTEKSYFPPGDGEVVEIDAKWALNKRRYATAGLMARLNELWPLIERTNVHRVTFPFHTCEGTRIVTEHTNDSDFIRRIKFIMKWLRWEEWTCDLIHLKNQEELEEVQPSKEFCGRTCGKGYTNSENDELGDKGWITRTLFEAIKQAEVFAYKEANRVRREEAENVRVVRYFARVDGRMKSKEGGTNSDRVLENIDLINKEIVKKDPCKKFLWETWVPPIKDDKSLTDLQDSDGGCIRVRERGEDYGDKIDGIYEVDKKWYREEDSEYSGSESEDDEEDYFEECYEGTWSTRDLLIAQDKAAKKADWFPSHLRLENVSKKTSPSTEKTDFKKESSKPKEEGALRIRLWMERKD